LPSATQEVPPEGTVRSGGERPGGGPSGLTAILFAGANSFRGATGADVDTGFRAGAILGGRVGAGVVALNGELSLDILNLKGPANAGRNTVELDLAFSPLLVLGSETVSFVLGPKIGLWGGSSWGPGGEALAGGVALGANTGLFLRTGAGVSIGALFGFVWRAVNELCVEPDGQGQVCRSNPDIAGDKVLSGALALLF
jgi:hypothetical protein